MGTNAHILVVSRDQMLLQTRKLILGAYFKVDTAGRLPEIEALLTKNNFDLVVLCHTLSETDCQQILRMIRQQVRQPLLLMLTAQSTDCRTDIAGQQLTSEGGPLELLKKCAGMLGFVLKRKGRALPVMQASAAGSE